VGIRKQVFLATASKLGGSLARIRKNERPGYSGLSTGLYTSKGIFKKLSC